MTGQYGMGLRRPDRKLVHKGRRPPRGEATLPVETPLAAAGLRYVTFAQPGITRTRSSGGFEYRDPEGQVVLQEEVLARIQRLAIPPSWEGVWICLDPMGHLQAVGRDLRGRRQYRYHPLWRQVRDTAKFEELLELVQALPALRRRLARDLSLPGLTREKVLAAVVWLLETTLIRVGNEEYARENMSFGLTTLQDLHAQVMGLEIRFEFIGKSGKHHVVPVQDARLADIVKQCQELPGQELFQYMDHAEVRHDVSSEDVNAYLQETGGQKISAKDFRTWMATVYALDFLQKREPPRNSRQANTAIVECMRAVARLLGNTPTTARKSYVHPEVLRYYSEGRLRKLALVSPGKLDLLSEAERRTVAFLRMLDDARKGASA